MSNEKNGLARHLEDAHANLGEVEDAARKLQNQNFADLIKGARGKLQQAMEHADLGEVDGVLTGEHDGGQKPAGHDSGQSAAI